MSELQFDDQTNEFGRPPASTPSADLTGKIIAWGLASNREQAQYVMIGVLVAVIVLTLLVYFFWI